MRIAAGREVIARSFPSQALRREYDGFRETANLGPKCYRADARCCSLGMHAYGLFQIRFDR